MPSVSEVCSATDIVAQPQVFEEFLSDDDAVRGTLLRVGQAAAAKGFGTGIEMAALVLLFPLVG